VGSADADTRALYSGRVPELPQIGPRHPAVRRALAIQRNSAPNPERLVFAEGLWAQDCLLEHETPIHTFLRCPEAADRPEPGRRAEQILERAERAFRISTKTLARITERTTPDGLISLAPLPRLEAETFELGQSALVMVADGMEIPGNLGTLIRTLDACRADCLLLTNRKTRLTHPKVFRASQGVVLRLPVLELDRPEAALAWLTERGFSVYLADAAGARTYRRYDYRNERTAFVLGSEKYGIPKPWYEAELPRVAVPMLGAVDSLNVAISAAVLLFEARAQKDDW
jgi:tRNA G18 (ribose-2'-O)-methylase SpoU